MTKEESSSFSFFSRIQLISRRTASDMSGLPRALRDNFESSRPLCGLDPLAMFADQIFQPIDGFRLGNVEFPCRFADVQIPLARCPAHVAKIGVRHFTRPIHDATHDRDLDAF